MPEPMTTRRSDRAWPGCDDALEEGEAWRSAAAALVALAYFGGFLLGLALALAHLTG